MPSRCFSKSRDDRLRAVIVATHPGLRARTGGSTSKMTAEAAICLARDVDSNRTPGGVWTPAAAMGKTLIERLQAKAGLGFSIVDP